ncbi:MAG TPA: lipopolysaccharide kinase InaA family protein [Planctomycetota bacterium]|jgi:serine/threonine protein kinase|nr:lipopolysaccharide kinase InaA family protein [Planctomycetota bacterium]
MVERIYRRPTGTMCIQGWEGEVMDSAADLAFRLAADDTKLCERLRFGPRCDPDGPAWVKAGPLTGSASLRHGLRRLLPWRHAPTIQEYFNLSWLIERHIRTPLPIAAGVLLRHGLPRYQFMLTVEAVGAVTLAEFLENGPPAERAEVLDELARETARMHALGFIHHDLFPRNILLEPRSTDPAILVTGERVGTWPGPVGITGAGRRLLFLDAWAGGPAPQLRGPAYDIACLMLHADELFTGPEQERFFRVYLAERTVQERPVEPTALFRDTTRARRSLVRKLAARPSRLRGYALPDPGWKPPPLTTPPSSP